MSAGILTNAGRDLFAAKQGAAETLIIDRFLLANIAGLNPNDPVNPDEPTPAPGDQVATLAVTQTGYVNADKVVYSLYMGTGVGDFTFNWVGLLADDDTLVAVRYIDPITKTATVGQDLGNAITRNFLITYTDAKAITNVSIEAATWQIQFDQATELTAGVAEIATQTETDTGTDDTRFITPLKLHNSKTGKSTTSVITSSGSYIPPPGVRALKFIAVGGGGGGGGVDGQGSGTAAQSATGSAAGVAIKTTTVIDASYTIVIGAGGSGGAAGNNAGGSGGTTTIVDDGPGTNINLSAGGGGGGPGMLGSALTQTAIGQAGGIAAGGDINITGDYGASGRTVNGFVTNIADSPSSIFGGSVRPGFESAGNNAQGFGAGGSAVTAGSITGNFAGGNGGNGVVVVEEIY